MSKSTRIRLIEAVKARTAKSIPHPSQLGRAYKQTEFLDNEIAEDVDITYEQFEQIERFLKCYCGDPFEESYINTKDKFEWFIGWILKEINKEKERDDND